MNPVFATSLSSENANYGNFCPLMLMELLPSIEALKKP
ncbi:hypothetical protein HNQ65_002771 [Prosthecobacter vanneervenii]|uniref:Uncharacterized protein n=1 Tax=Prosthecobacter vanneervenii TaxID=48466 RepID=A0A7W7YBJ7_9BACT|nr:hypothetical protein [Prosthecobacter vanneervenii]